MATSYTDLKTEIADFYERNDLSLVVDTFIDLCESEMQRELKLVDFESEGSVTVTAGVGSVPTGFSSARSVWWDGSPERTLRYVPPDEWKRISISQPSNVNYYTVIGDEIKVSDDGTGTLKMIYTAGFTPLSDANTANFILTSHPGAYLYGALKHAAAYCKDFDNAIAYQTLFANELKQISRDSSQRKFIGQLQVRTA